MMKMKCRVAFVAAVILVGTGSAIAGTSAPVPTVSEWSLAVMTLLGMAAGTIMFGGIAARRRR